MRTFKHCPTCGNDLEKTGITSTRHDIYQCSTCQAEFVGWFDELKPVIDHVQMFSVLGEARHERLG